LISVLETQPTREKLLIQRFLLVKSSVIGCKSFFLSASSGTNSAEELVAIQGQIDSSLDALDFLGSITGFALPASLDALREGGSANVVNGDAAAGAELLEKQINSIALASAAAGAYVKYTLELVGGYAVRINWSDGHNSGLFTWERLRELSISKQ